VGTDVGIFSICTREGLEVVPSFASYDEPPHRLRNVDDGP
jgi:hypothetical protein